MLRSDTLFGKRENATPNAPKTSHSPLGNAVTLGLTAPADHVKTESVNVDAALSATDAGSKLIVGPNIKLKGVEITDCDTLIVEGQVEATIGSRLIQIAECGAFQGMAEIDIAEIRGQFNGDLIVRQKLTIHATGKVSGKVRYGKLVVEEGGQMIGDVQVVSASASLPSATGGREAVRA